MAVAAYFDQVSGFTTDMLLGALIDAGTDRTGQAGQADQAGRKEIEAALKRHHGVDCEISVEAGQVDRTWVAYASLSAGGTSAPESFRAIPGEEDTPAGLLIRKVITHLEKNVNDLWGTRNQVPSDDEVGGRQTALGILALCNALHLHGIDVLYHEALPFAAGIDPTPPLHAALMRGVAIRPVDRAPADLAGCAVLTALSAGMKNVPDITLRKVGYGGHGADRDHGELVRLCTGDIVQPVDCESVQVLETQIDDMNPQFYSHVVDLLLESGALDAFLTPVIMKKSRPGVLLTVLSPPALADRLSELILKETTTIGLRSYSAARRVLPRREATVETPYGAVRIKVVLLGDSRRYTPEYEDCREAARKTGVPLADVYAAVHDAAGRMELDNLP